MTVLAQNETSQLTKAQIETRLKIIHSIRNSDQELSVSQLSNLQREQNALATQWDKLHSAA